MDNTHQKAIEKKRRATTNDDDDDNDETDEEYAPSGGLQQVDNDWWRKVVDKNQLENASSSHKIIILFEILNECKRTGDKCVIFSSFVEVLNVVEFFMQQIDQRNGKNGLENFVGPWRKNEDFYRLDGSTPKDRRHSMIRNFNDVDNRRTKVFLISAQAGGQGINLFGANRLILLDTSWNPATDQQSIFRIYRMGQTKQCYIYRLLSMGTMEEKIYSRSVTKQAMSCRVVDKQQIDRHYSMNELDELYSLTKTDMGKRVAPIPPKDDILAHLLRKYPNKIFKYLEHDSLLANKVEEELNEIEKNEAWQTCQEQNLQMQALNNMMSNGQQTVMPLQFHNQIVPALELKDRSVVNSGKKAVYAQHNKENVLCSEMAGSTSQNTIGMEHEPSDDNKKKDVQRLTNIENTCGDNIEQGASSSCIKMEQKHNADKLSSPPDGEHEDGQTSLKHSNSYEWLPAKNEIVTPIESSNVDVRRPLSPLTNIENVRGDKVEQGAEPLILSVAKDVSEPLLFFDQPSSSCIKMEQKHNADKLSSPPDGQHEDGQTSLKHSNSYEWLPAKNEIVTPIESSNVDVRRPLSPLTNIENVRGDKVEQGAEPLILSVAKDVSEPLLFFDQPSSTSIKMEHDEDKLSSFSDKQQLDARTSMQRSKSFECSLYAMPIETSKDDSQGPLLPLENVDNGGDDKVKEEAEGQLSAIANDIFESTVFLDRTASTSNEVERDTKRMDTLMPLQRSQSYEWIPASDASSIELSHDVVQGPLMLLQNDENGSNDSLNRDVRGSLLSLENVDNGSTDSLRHDAQERLKTSENRGKGEKSPLLAESKRQPNDFFDGQFTSNGMQSDCCESKGSDFTDNERMEAETSVELSKSCQRSANLKSTWNDDTRVTLLPLENVDNGSSKSPDRDIQQLPLENGENHGNMEGRVERSLSDFVKGLLHSLNNEYAASFPQPYSMADYAIEEQIIRPNQFNNLEYRIALKRPSDGIIPRPIKRLKLLLEIDPTVSSYHSLLMFDSFMSECQRNAIMERPQPLNTGDANVCFLNQKGEEKIDSNALLNEVVSENSSDVEEVCPNSDQQPKELSADLPPNECVAMDIESDEIIVKTNGSEEKELDGGVHIKNEQPSPLSMNVDDEEIYLNESTEQLNLNDHSHRVGHAEDEHVSSNDHSEEADAEDDHVSSNDHSEESVTPTFPYAHMNRTQSENEQDSSAGMSESETSDTEDLSEVEVYEVQPSTMSKITERCALM